MLICMACASFLAGQVVHPLAYYKPLALLEPMASRVPADRHSISLAVGAARTASYLTAFVGGTILILRVRRGRQQLVEALSGYLCYVTVYPIHSGGREPERSLGKAVSRGFGVLALVAFAILED